MLFVSVVDYGKTNKIVKSQHCKISKKKVNVVKYAKKLITLNWEGVIQIDWIIRKGLVLALLFLWNLAPLLIIALKRNLKSQRPRTLLMTTTPKI